MLNSNNFPEMSTPLVRERSVVQSHAAAPENPVKSTGFCPAETPIGAFRYATEHERTPSKRAESVRDVLEAFEDWLDQQVLPPDIAEHANFVLAYLRMAEDHPLPAPLRRELARHVDAIANGRL
jgi:hypothetical protein